MNKIQLKKHKTLIAIATPQPGSKKIFIKNKQRQLLYFLKVLHVEIITPKK